MIYTFIPYSDEKNLGDAYNAFLGLLGERDWAVLLDHDAMFTTYDWFRRIKRLVEAYPLATFVGVTNRIGCRYQRCSAAPLGDDIRQHREFGESLPWDSLIDVSEESRELVGGVCVVISKATWRAVGGFRQNGILGVDNDLHRRIKAAGRALLVAEGLYLYHWYRGGSGDRHHLEKPLDKSRAIVSNS